VAQFLHLACHLGISPLLPRLGIWIKNQIFLQKPEVGILIPEKIRRVMMRKMATIRKSKTHIINNDKQDFYGRPRASLRLATPLVMQLA